MLTFGETIHLRIYLEVLTKPRSLSLSLFLDRDSTFMWSRSDFGVTVQYISYIACSIRSFIEAGLHLLISLASFLFLLRCHPLFILRFMDLRRGELNNYSRIRLTHSSCTCMHFTLYWLMLFWVSDIVKHLANLNESKKHLTYFDRITYASAMNIWWLTYSGFFSWLPVTRNNCWNFILLPSKNVMFLNIKPYSCSDCSHILVWSFKNCSIFGYDIN